MEGQLTIILCVMSALLGGGFVGLLNYSNNKRKSSAGGARRDAHVIKLVAEAERIRAETDNIRKNMEGVKSELAKTRRDIQLHAKEIGWVKLLITLTTSDNERTHLRFLASDGPYVTEAKKGSALEWELRHLLTLNLVGRLPRKGIRTLLNRGKVDIKRHLSITERGRQYLGVLEEVNSP